MLAEHLKNIPHLKLNLTFPNECYNEILSVKDFYGLTLKQEFSKELKDVYYNTNKGHALRSYSGLSKHAYYTPNSNAIDIDKRYLKNLTYFNTPTWFKLKETTNWIQKNICEEKNLKMVCLHKMTANSNVGWHSHYDYKEPYHTGIVHISINTNNKDISEVETVDKQIIAKNYPQNECWLFNSWLKHRSINLGSSPRLHLVLECDFSDKIFSSVINESLKNV